MITYYVNLEVPDGDRPHAAGAREPQDPRAAALPV